MRRKATLAVSIAFATCALLHPQSTSAQNSTNVSMPDPNVSLSTAQREAALMVPAQATLDKAIDARKIQPGQQFQAKLTGTVYLKNGLELPRDTVLVGTIATDKMRAGGTSTLALRFTKAELKGGKVVPIQADIMGVSRPTGGENWENISGAAPSLPWNGKTLRVDELGALSGVDLHSAVAAPNSGVFVSTKKDDMKLSPGSKLSLAIAAQGASGMGGGA